MANKLRSSTTTQGRNMAGARALWRATGFKDEDFQKPIIAICNSFTQFVPGHVHLKDVGQQVKQVIDQNGGKGVEFNTIAVDDGIAMGHDGMLYSLPSRDLIADSVEYMVNAHKADALICISNCDKITPGMQLAAMRLNLPTIFVSGGPMEAGRSKDKKLDLIHPMIAAGDDSISDEELSELENEACPTCGSCSGMFTANSMNCLNEALGLALPGNGTLLATHKERWRLFEAAAINIVFMAKQYYLKGNQKMLPRNIVTKKSFENAMALDIAMGGSTNTVLHILAIAEEGGVDFKMADIDRISKKIPTLCKVAPSSDYHVEDVHRAGGIMAILEELHKGGLLHENAWTVSNCSLEDQMKAMSVRSAEKLPELREAANKFYRCAPGGAHSVTAFYQDNRYHQLDVDDQKGCIRSIQHAYTQEGGLCVLYGNLAEHGSIVKTAGVDESLWAFTGPARIFHSQEAACEAILGDQIKPGDAVIICYEGPKGGPGMQEMLYPTSYLKSKKLGDQCALITDGRFSGGTSGLSVGHISPEAAEGGALGLVEEGDIIEIDIRKRLVQVQLSAAELQSRRIAMEKKLDQGFKPVDRVRPISVALQAYSLMCTSAARGAVRDLSQLKPQKFTTTS